MRRSIFIPLILGMTFIGYLLATRLCENRISESLSISPAPSKRHGSFFIPKWNPRAKKSEAKRTYETGEIYVWPSHKDAMAAMPSKEDRCLPDFKTWSQTPEFRQVKNIVPPVNGLQPPAQASLITPELIEKGGIVALGFNAFLHLPENALVDEFGNPVNEPVKISYCPLSDPVDVYLSGVSMQYDSGGVAHTFRTAGMVRLEASTQDGRQVQLKEGSEMRLDMPTVDTADTYNFYTFDESAGQWTWNRPAAPARPAIDLVVDTIKVNYGFDTVAFAAKFNDLKYHGEVHERFKKTEKRIMAKGESRYRNRRGYRHYGRGYAYERTRLIRLVAYRVFAGHDADKKPIHEVRFTMAFNGAAGELFPELISMKRVVYTATDCKTVKEFYEKYTRGKRFLDVRLAYTKGTNVCLIRLKEEQGFTEINASVVNGKSTQHAFQRRQFLWKYAQYTKRLRHKEESHDQRVRDRMRRVVAGLFKGQGLWFANNQYRQITIPGFATYNCDQITRMVNPIAFKAQYYRADGTRIKKFTMTVYDRRVGAAFTFHPHYKIDPACSKGGFVFAMIHDDESDKLYLLTADQMMDGMFPAQCDVLELTDDLSPAEIKKMVYPKGKG